MLFKIYIHNIIEKIHISKIESENKEIDNKIK